MAGKMGSGGGGGGGEEGPERAQCASGGGQTRAREGRGGRRIPAHVTPTCALIQG